MIFLKSKHKNTASVVDGKLILSFPKAQTPTLWQMDLNDAKTSALEVKSSANDCYTLCMKPTKGDAVDIATFSKQDGALEGLMAVSKALEKAHGQFSSKGEGAPVVITAPIKLWKKILMFLGGFFVLFFIWSVLQVGSYQNTGYVAPTGAPLGSVSPAPQSGVPMSADDFLRGQ